MEWMNKKGLTQLKKFIIPISIIIIIGFILFISASTITHNLAGNWTGTFNFTQITGNNVTLNDNDTIQELPNNQQINKGNMTSWFNMTGNVLLMHLNVNSATQVDDSGSPQNNGTVNGATYTSSGKLNSAYSFDGVNDGIVSNYNIDNDIAYTFSMWVKPNSLTGSQALTVKIGNGMGMYLGTVANKYRIYCGDGVNAVNSITNATTGWIYVVGTLNSTTMNLYLDGQLDATLGGVLTDTVSNLSIGINGVAQPFNGSIDEVAIWNRSLSANEIANIYNNQKGNYFPSGDYISQVIDAGASVQWNNLTFTNLSYGEGLKFQLSSCNDALCSGETLVGPSNTSSTYFTSSPITLNTTLTPNNQYFQYKAFYNSTNTSLTAHLASVSVDYSALDTTNPNINLTYPLNTTYSANVTQLNYTYTETSPDSCWYSLNLGATNSSRQTCGTNWTGLSSNANFNTWKVYINDTSGNKNTSTISFSVIINPTISITYPPNATSYNITNLNVNYSLSGAQANTCIWTNNTGVTNTTLTNCANITSVTWSEGTQIVNIWANSSTDQWASASVTFTIDLTPPLLTIRNPNPSGTSIFKGDFNLSTSVYDSEGIWDINISINGSTNNIVYSNYTNELNRTNVYINDSISASTFADGNYTIKFFIQDIHTDDDWNPSVLITSGIDYKNFDFNGENVKVTIQSLIPTNSLSVSQTISDFREIKLKDRYSFDITFSEKIETYNIKIEADNIKILGTKYKGHLIINNKYWFDTEPYNSVVKETGKGYVILTILNGNSLTSSFNSLGGLNSVVQYVNFRVDNTNPAITINYPLNYQNFSITQVNVNSTITDINLDSCWYSNNTGQTNTTFICGTNLTTQKWGEGLITVYVYANDSLGNQNSSNIIFRIDTTKPYVKINYPTNAETFGIKDINVNYTYFDTGVGIIQNCWYSNNTGATNHTITNCLNLTNINWEEGSNTIYASVNDTLGNQNSSTITFTIDTIAPSFTNMQNFTQMVNDSFSYNFDATDTGIGLGCFSINDTINWNINCSGYLQNITNIYDAGMIWLNVSVNDTIGNRNSDTFFINVTAFISDSEHPLFSNYTQIPSNNTAYSSGAGLEFNTTITSTNGNVIFTFDGSNYTATNLSATIYNVTLYDLPAGNYQYTWSSYGNGTSALFNSTTRDYTIARATTILSLNVPSDVQNGQQTTATGTGCPSGLTCNLFRNNTLVSNPDTQTLPVGIYTYVYNISQTQNYTVDSVSDILTVHLNYGLNITQSDKLDAIYNCLILGIGCYNNGRTWNLQEIQNAIWNYTSGRYINGELQ